MNRFLRRKPRPTTPEPEDVFAAKDAQRDYATFRRTSTPLYDQTRDTLGFTPTRPLTVDDLLAEVDLLRGPIVTGTLVGPVEDEVA
ncbi:hypothetical protein [Cellulomonas composti]|uniref:Uncharacterized protein n=1 Tax=Cellulomonas composti TaxID=266130 RepID=A0A511JBN9_9CELL|nr:hypothetical protein [Cellulomonas composti]GEL95396.1 hypothetical protein CCO02nite_20540 [Cellulomonas composti]